MPISPHPSNNVYHLKAMLNLHDFPCANQYFHFMLQAKWFIEQLHIPSIKFTCRKNKIYQVLFLTAYIKTIYWEMWLRIFLYCVHLLGCMFVHSTVVLNRVCWNGCSFLCRWGKGRSSSRSLFQVSNCILMYVLVFCFRFF